MKNDKFEAKAKGVTYVVRVSKCGPSPSTQTAEERNVLINVPLPFRREIVAGVFFGFGQARPEVKNFKLPPWCRPTPDNIEEIALDIVNGEYEEVSS